MTNYPSLDAEAARLDAWNTATYHVALLTSAVYSGTVTFTNAAANIGATGHTLVVGCQVKFSTTGTLPTSVNNTATYWVVAVSAGTTFQVSATRGGTAITHNGSGSPSTHTATEQDLIVTTANTKAACQVPIAAVINKEVASYNSSARQLLPSIPATIIDYTTNQVSTIPATDVTVTFTPGVGFTYRYIAVIRGGNATRGDVTGVIANLEKLATDTTMPGTGQTIRVQTGNFVA